VNDTTFTTTLDSDNQTVDKTTINYTPTESNYSYDVDVA
jgi:hypothetical protein